MPDTTDLTFPANVIASTNLSTLPFITPTTQFTPFDVTKEESTANLIGDPITTTLTVHGNSMGALKHFHLQDVIPANRSFLGFTLTGANVGGVHVTYDAPAPGQVTLDIVDITVPTGTNVQIQYQTLPVAYGISSYSGTTPILDTGSVVPHNDSSPNTVLMHTGASALVGGPYPATTWNNGSADVLVNASSLLPPRTTTPRSRYMNLAKSVNKQNPVIGEVLTYTLQLATAKNAAYTTNGSGTYIEDILPDGLNFSGAISSTLSGSGTPLTFISATTNADGDTTLLWRLNSGMIGADLTNTIIYQAVVDGVFEGVGDTEYENTEVLTNVATFYGTVGDGGLSGVWGQTDSSIIDSEIIYTTDSSARVQATVSAPNPITKKHLISVTTPGGTVYDFSTGLPSKIPAGSALKFAVTMDFPNVNFIDPKVIDALPLLAGPNTSAYDFAFQTDPSLKDIYNSGVAFNTNDGVTPVSDFNGNTLIGTTMPNAPWIVASPANNLEFHLGSGMGGRTFAMTFVVNVLATKPVGGVPTNGLVPLTNFAYSSFNNDAGVPNPLPIMEIPFDVNFPSVTATKTASGGTNVEAGKPIEYTISLRNQGSADAFLENIIDTLPANMDFLTGSVTASGSSASLSNVGFSQSGTILSIEFATGAATGGRSLIPLDTVGTPSVQENVVLVRYTVVPNSNFLIQGGATRTNTVSLDYYASSGAVANGVNNLGPVTANANVTVKSPAFSRSIVSTSEGDSSGVNLLVGEEVVYRTTITLPQGTFSLANYTELIHPNLEFLSGTVMASSGALTITGSTLFSGASIPFGTIINTDTDPATLEMIVLETTYRVRQNATAGTNYTNNGVLTYSSTSASASLNVNVVKPILTLTKNATPNVGQYGTTILYTVTLSNASTTAPAYDISLRDILPASLDYITGSLSIGTFSGTESDIFASGLTLDMLGTATGQSFTFQATPKSSVRPADVLTNQVLAGYDTLDDDLSPYEWSGSVSANANFLVQDIAIDHTITSTNLADTTSSLFSGSLTDMAIGEQVVYRTDISIPESTFTGMTITQTLPAGMKFLSGSILVDGVKSHTLSNVVIGPDNVITFSLGDVDNAGIGAGSGITIETQAVLLDQGTNTAGVVKTSNITVNYSEKSKAGNSQTIEVVEPTLSITKVYSPNSGDAGDTIPTTVTIQNISNVTAYEVILTDVTAGKTTPDAGFSGSIAIGTLNPGEIRTYNYNTILNTNVSPGEILTGTATIQYTSFPGIPTDGERTYSVSDTDAINIINSGALLLTLLSSSNVAVGDVAQYEIRIPVSEGNTNTLNVSSLIPAGMAIIPGSISITSDSAVSYSGTVTPVISPLSEGITTGQTQSIQYPFSDIVNTDSDNGTTEYIHIRYDAVVLDSTDTNLGNTKIHTATANYEGGADIKNASALPVTIVEPYVNLSVTNTYANGYSVPYTFTITNTGTATAYDLDLSTLLPSGVTYTGAISITNSGGAVNLAQVGDTFHIDTLPINTGNPLIFTILGSISQGVPNSTPLTLTGTVTYTSEAGAYSSVIANPLNQERTALGGVDDYIDANKTTSFILNIALLDESISVVDINTGTGMIDDVFEYTITLTNTGNVALTNIPVTLDIPAGFTGFTVMSTPGGSVDASTATGGINGNGYIDVSGISLAIGQSRTIVYRVTALHTLDPATTIPTTATVGNSSEGAIGGTPSVPVTIHAPRFIVTAHETDNNGGVLLSDDTITHTLTLVNSGSTPGTTVTVSIPWSTGATYVTGSLIFQTGTLIDTGSIMIDEINNLVTFTIPNFPVGAPETIVYQTRAIGPVGTMIQTQIELDSLENIGATGFSNILTISTNVSISPGPGGGGAGSSGTPARGTSTTLISPKNITPVPTILVPDISKNTEKPEKSPKKPRTSENRLEQLVAEYQTKFARLQQLTKEEQTPGTSGILKYPKLLPQTGKTILERIKKLSNVKLSLDAPVFSK